MAKLSLAAFCGDEASNVTRMAKRTISMLTQGLGLMSLTARSLGR